MKRLFMLLSVVPLLMGILAMTGTPAFATTFSNTNAITTNDAPSCGFDGRATLYPSGISVSGLGSSVSDVNVTLSGLDHTYPDDVGVLLVGPQGQSTILMADTGGENDVSGANLPFDDAASGTLPDDGQLSSGTYKPTSGETSSICAAPSSFAYAPAGPYGSVLSDFNGTNPNGTWQLYVIDDSPGDGGSISGWSLDIGATAPPDTTAPDATITSGPDEGSTSTSASASFGFSSSETGSTFQCSLDNTAYTACTSPQGYTNLSNGSHTFDVKATDAAVNTGSPASRTWTVSTDDTTAPTVEVSPAHLQTGVATTANVTASFSEEVQGVTRRTFTLESVVVNKRGVEQFRGVSAQLSTQLFGPVGAKVTEATLDPAKDLKSGSYRVTITNVTDVAGNPLAPWTSNFTTASVISPG
jgi:subtilisin-like proprotein convertase family protein